MDADVQLGEAGGLAYRAAGSGRPLVLLHPGAGLDGSVFFPEVLSLTERGVRVIAFDLPANGRSAAPDRSDWTIAGFARIVMDAVRELGLEPGSWDLLGHSFGGYVALELNNLHRGEAARMIASCTIGSEEPPPEGTPGELEELPETERAAIEAVWERESRATTPEELKQAWLDQVDYWSSPAGADRVRERFQGVTYQPGPNQHEDWGELEALEALAAIPVLAIAAEHDPIPRVFQQRIADASPRGTLAVIEGAGHFPFVETPDRYWPIVARWLEETAP
jgi:pimeloyl-ACP methyl ester carboxylesterase